jgi:regulator of replication initiation timing
LQRKAVKRIQPFASGKRLSKGRKKPIRRSLLAALQRMAPPTISAVAVDDATQHTTDATPVVHPTVQQSCFDTSSVPVMSPTTAMLANTDSTQQVQLLEARLQAALAEAAKEKAVRQRADDQVRSLTLEITEFKTQLDTASEEVARLMADNDRLNVEATTLHSKSFTHSLAKPTTFSGMRAKNSLQARDWLQSVIDYMHSANNAPTELQQVQFAESYLVGEARRAWHAARITLATPTETDSSPYAGITFAKFQQSIIDRWDPACSEISRMTWKTCVRRELYRRSFPALIASAPMFPA